MKINIYKSVHKAYNHLDDILDLSFTGLVELLEEANSELTNKTDTQLFNVCSTIDQPEPPPELTSKGKTAQYPMDRHKLIRRCKSNVDLIYCLLLDVDDTMTIEEAVTKWQQYEFAIYSTYSNSDNKDKFRLILPLANPITMLEADERHSALCNEFNVDKASFTISQCFYFPSYSKANKHLSYIVHNKSKLRYELLGLAVEEINTNILTDFTPPDTVTPMGRCVYRTLLTGSDLHYADVLSLATVCKSYGITASDFTNIVTSIANPDSDLRTKKVNLRGLYKKGFNTHVTNKTAVKLMRRLNCDTWRFTE